MLIEKLIYRLMPPAQWEMALGSGHLPYNEHDQADGFMHLSAPAQTLETADKHYTAHTDLVAVGIDPDTLGPDLKWEPSRGGQLFPHFYGFVPAELVIHRVQITKSAAGGFACVAVLEGEGI